MMSQSSAASTAAHQAASWQQSLAGLCAPFAVAPLSSEFSAAIELRKIGAFRCTRVVQSAVEACRTTGEIAAAPASDFLLILQMSGKAHVEQAGRGLQLQQGELTLIDLTQPSLFAMRGKSTQLCLHIPRPRLLEQSSDALPVAIRLSLPIGAMLGPLLRTAYEQCAHFGAHSTAISDSLLGLLNAGLHIAVPSLSAPGDDKNFLLEEIKELIRDRLADEITPRSIAWAKGISERHLHRLFELSGTTVGRWIKAARLARCADDLRDPVLANRTVTEIAFEWGFHNMAHFSREFRHHYSQPPTAYRANARRGLS